MASKPHETQENDGPKRIPQGIQPKIAEVHRQPEEINARARAIELLNKAGVPFLVGGTYAYAVYTGIYRDTKDLDLFVRERDAEEALQVFERAGGWRTERNVHGWLHKAWWNDYLIDLIYSSGNGVTVVDEDWFLYARASVVLGHPVKIPPPEEIIWSKGFVLERERYDGGDLNHLFLRAGPALDWGRLLQRFDRHWELLLAHVMIFRFAYPSERNIVPDWVLRELMARTEVSVERRRWKERVCRGSLTSGQSYSVDLEDWGFEDAREYERKRRETLQRETLQRESAPPEVPPAEPTVH